MNDPLDWSALEEIVHRDPAGRGLASFRTAAGKSIDTGQLGAAAEHLARHAKGVGIVTGFCVVDEGQVTAETDGPPGALLLARVLATLGVEVTLIADRYAIPLLVTGCDFWELDRGVVCESPMDAERSDAWIEALFAARAGRWTHLIAIERPAPSHTLASLRQHLRAGAAPVDLFESLVPPADRDVCHNMRGQSIDAWTAPTHRLFEWILRYKLAVTTIGIGDGGNELGMGHFAWETLVTAIGTEVAGRIISRVATDYALVAGVSNWGAYALALAVARLRGAGAAADNCTAAAEGACIQKLVHEAGAVDGLTRRHEATVDGLPLDEYLQPLIEMRALLGYE